MLKRLTERNALPALMAALAGVLLLLAALQYAWIGEMSEADRGRLSRGLGVVTEQYRRDFNRELDNLADSFRMEPDALEQEDWGFLAEDYYRWMDSGPVGLRIDSIYILRSEQGTALPALKLDPHSGRFEETDAPPDIHGYSDLRGGRPPGRFGGGPRDQRTTLWAFLPDGPALTTALITRDPRGRGRGEWSITGQIVIRLNREAILQILLPDIESRLISATGDQPYQLAVIENSVEPRLLYTNSQGTLADFRNSERLAPLVYSLEELFARAAARRSRLGGLESPDGELPPERDLEDRGFAPRSTVSSLPDAPSWTLAARLSGGSVDDVVSSLRTRNLGISIGILLLLSAGMGLALVSARRAERLAQLQMDFVAGVSHELRTPIAVIRQAADNLAEGVVSSPEQTREYGKLMRAEGRRLTNMVEQTLQFASSRSAKQRYSIETLSPATLVEQAVADVRSEMMEANVDWRSHLEDNLPAVKGDSAAVKQCLRNLLSNAVKYGGLEKKITLSAAVDGRFVRFDVADSGMGISPDDLPHIFDPFYRGRQAVDAQIQGSGLGLSLAREAAEASGGTLEATSQLGAGSTFTLRLPIAAREEASVR